MQFFTTIKDSIYSPDFYRTLRAKPLSFSLKYYFSLAAVLALAGTVLMTVQFLPKAQFALTTLAEKVVERFPAELEVTFKGGVVSTNVKEPYFVKETPGEADALRNEVEDAGTHENLLVIDTSSPLSLELFK